MRGYTDRLQHHGILGMKWGVRRTPEELGHRNLRRAKTSNIDKWGADAEHNILYVTGYSGSGKSTVAKSFANKKTNVIHLDGYVETHFTDYELSKIRDAEFDRFLKQNFKEYDLFHASLNSRNNVQNTEKMRLMDKFAAQTERFSEAQFRKGKRVVIEGIQLNDSTLYPDKSFFVDKPVIITGTNAVQSFFRARKRDGIFVESIQSAVEYAKWYSESNKNLKHLSVVVDAKRGSKFVEDYLKGGGS